MIVVEHNQPLLDIFNINVIPGEPPRWKGLQSNNSKNKERILKKNMYTFLKNMRIISEIKFSKYVFPEIWLKNFWRIFEQLLKNLVND